MITKKKLLSLKDNTRLRKISIILHDAAFEAAAGRPVDMQYINDIIPLADFEPIAGAGIAHDADVLEGKGLAIALDDMSKSILARLGSEPSDWDFRTAEGSLDVNARVIQDKILILDRIRSPYNVGAIFRSADSFGIRRIILVDGTASPEHVRAKRTSMGTTSTVDWTFMSQTDVVAFLKSYDPSNVLALEVGGEDINGFDFPLSGVAVLGSEEFGISPAVLACTGRRVSIPMGGSKGSLNVSVAAGILMQHWYFSPTEA